MDNRTKPFVNKQRLKVYLWLALAYWLLWILIDTATDAHTPEGQATPKVEVPAWMRVVNNFWRTIYVLGINFIFFEYTLPFIRRLRNIILKIILLLFFAWVQMMLISFGLYAWRAIGIGLHTYIRIKTFPNVMEGVTYGVGYGMFSIFFFGVGIHLYNYVKLRQAAQQLRIEKQQAELNYLKSQTNPHFLFNTLNNIYSLARDKSDLAPESIMRLSKILRFMLYETSGAYICIEQELKIISDYIELEKLRYDESLHINFNYDVEDMKQAVPPLLLMPLVENAFKHGVSETRSRPFIDIHLSVNKRQLKFVVKNSTEASPEEKNVKENIGLSNLRRQLELLYTQYELSVQHGAHEFTAILKINLATHV